MLQKFLVRYETPLDLLAISKKPDPLRKFAVRLTFFAHRDTSNRRNLSNNFPRTPLKNCRHVISKCYFNLENKIPPN